MKYLTALLSLILGSLYCGFIAGFLSGMRAFNESIGMAESILVGIVAMVPFIPFLYSMASESKVLLQGLIGFLVFLVLTFVVSALFGVVPFSFVLVFLFFVPWVRWACVRIKAKKV